MRPSQKDQDNMMIEKMGLSMWEMVRDMPLSPINIGGFYMSNMPLIEEEDISQSKKAGMSLLKNFLIASFVGVFANVQLKHIPGLNFLYWNRWLRWLVRVPVLFVGYPLVHGSCSKTLSFFNKINDKYFTRLEKFQKTGDLNLLDPNRRLLQMIRQQAGENPKIQGK